MLIQINEGRFGVICDGFREGWRLVDVRLYPESAEAQGQSS
jgi:hypothetical protein